MTRFRQHLSLFILISIAILQVYPSSTGNYKDKIIKSNSPFISVRDNVYEVNKPSIGLWKESQLNYNEQVSFFNKYFIKQGYNVNLLSTADLLSADELSVDNFDVLIIPYPSYPAQGSLFLNSFLENGGTLITLNGNPFSNLIIEHGEEWVKIDSLIKNDNNWSKDIKWWDGGNSLTLNSTNKGKMVLNKLNVEGNGTDNSTFKFFTVNFLNNYIESSFSVDNLSQSSYGLGFDIRSNSTKAIAIEIKDLEGNRWKKIIDISPKWSKKLIHFSSFHAYANDKGDLYEGFLSSNKIKSISFGLLRDISGSGESNFEVKNINFMTGIFAPNIKYLSEIPLPDIRRTQRAYAAHTIKNDNSNVYWPSIFYSNTPKRVDGLKKSTDNSILTKGFHNVDFNKKQELIPLYKPLGVFENSEFKNIHRFIPLIESTKKSNATDIVVGLYILDSKSEIKKTPGTILSFGLIDFDYKTNSSLLKLADNVLSFVTRGVYLQKSVPQFQLNDDTIFVTDVASCVYSNLENKSKLKTSLSINGDTFDKKIVDKYRSCINQTIPYCLYDKNGYILNSYLLLEQDTIDEISWEVNLKEALISVSDFFATVGDNNGGKFSGTTFVDSRASRTLLAAYDLFNNQKYLDAAIKWTETVMKEQREDGGYRMGYGVSFMGEECYVADGGEIALGLLRVSSYLDSKQKDKILKSVGEYMSFRESFRTVEGFGVGWSAYDYSLPGYPPMGAVKKVFAPKRNSYTVSLTLATSLIYAKYVNDPNILYDTIKDSEWYMSNTKSLYGINAEGFVYAHYLVKDKETKTKYANFLMNTFVRDRIHNNGKWWLSQGGRNSLDLHNLAYIFHNIKNDSLVELEMMNALNSIVSKQSSESIFLLLGREDLSKLDWIYLCNSSLGIVEMIKPGASFKNL